jgi:AAA domain
MRIHRIKLQDFRGVEFADVGFEADGVTIIEGPNEIGKTSLADAFDLLLTQKDSAAKKQIKDARPIGRDVGPFVEAELTLGEYRLVYRKRWLREKMTELEIFDPAPEQASGEEAHLRMLGILAAETDQALFAALRYQQGFEISQAAIADAPSLSAALDAAAGGGEHDSTETGSSDVLLDLVDREQRKYFTPGGKILASRVEKAERVEALRVEVAATEADIVALDRAAEDLTQIEREIKDLEDRIPEIDKKVASGVEALEAVEAVERKAAAAEQAFGLAEAALGDATSRQDTRASLIEAAERAAGALAGVLEQIAAGESDLDDARRRVAEARQANAAAGEAVDEALKTAKVDRDGLELLRLSYERDDLRERRRRFKAADAEVDDAERFVAESVVDEGLIARLDELQTQIAVAAARVEAGQARVLIEALKPLELQLDSTQRSVEPGEVVEAVVVSETVAVIDDVARVVVVPSRGSAEEGDEVGLARAHLRELLETTGVDSVAAARDLLRERSRRESDCDLASQRREEALKDLKPAELAAKLERAERRLDEHSQGDSPVAPTAAAFEQARERVRFTEKELEATRAEAEQAKQAQLEVEGALRVLEDKGIEHRTRREATQEEVERTRAELEAARAMGTDGDLERAVDEAKMRLTTALTARDQVQTELETTDPEAVRATLENDRALKERLAADLSSRRVADARVREQLRLGGLEGLSDRLADTRAKLVELDREVDTEDRLAAAAKHLHHLLVQKREEAQRAYVGPFSEKVNFYARIIFGRDVRVDIDHRDFSLSSRTLDGTTVPFDLLSGGAREQLAVLARLACAALVSPGGAPDEPRGVPVIIDDALGYSDPSRLEKLGAAFGVAGKDCQVIVLTCEPGRYRGIGGAKVLSLERDAMTQAAVPC